MFDMFAILDKIDKKPILDEIEKYGKLLREYENDDGLNKIGFTMIGFYYATYLESKCISFGVVENTND